MQEYPILFTAPMVRAILDGRKTQTRRVVKPRKDIGFGCLMQPHELAGEVNNGDYSNCPYGKPGDRLWVRETFFDATKLNELRVIYRADDDKSRFGWSPSIHMPRWACRILLEITCVRVERLQDIGEADAQSEGPPKNFNSWRDNFCALWQQINGDRSWDANPWVWVVEFKRVMP